MNQVQITQIDAAACNNCGEPLRPDETYYCASCTDELFIESDPNGAMEDNDG